MQYIVYSRSALVLILLLFCYHCAQAQSADRVAVSVSYFGEFVGHPGINLGLEAPLAGSYQPGKRHSLLLVGSNLGGYRHKGNHTGLFVEAELGYRFVTKGGFKVETFLGTGYHRSFIDGPVYSINGANEVERVRHAGQNTFLISWSIGMGKQMKNSPVSWHIRPGLLVRAPHNSAILPHFYIETGISYHLKRLR